MGKPRDDAEDRSLVANAADPEQVRSAGGKEKRLRERELGDLKSVLGTKEGRRVLWRFLGFCGTQKTVIGSSDAETNYKAGMQNVGFYMMGEIVEADEELLFQMMRENQKEK